jgi:membrane protein YdbS with pleckstrin-like domain
MREAKKHFQKKKEKQYILTLLVSIMLIYVAFSFIEATFNPANWGYISRVLSVVVSLVWFIVITKNFVKNGK